MRVSTSASAGEQPSSFSPAGFWPSPPARGARLMLEQFVLQKYTGLVKPGPLEFEAENISLTSLNATTAILGGVGVTPLLQYAIVPSPNNGVFLLNSKGSLAFGKTKIKHSFLQPYSN